MHAGVQSFKSLALNGNLEAKRVTFEAFNQSLDSIGRDGRVSKFLGVVVIQRVNALDMERLGLIATLENMGPTPIILSYEKITTAAVNLRRVKPGPVRESTISDVPVGFATRWK